MEFYIWNTADQDAFQIKKKKQNSKTGSMILDNCIAGNKQDLALYMKPQYKQNRNRQKDRKRYIYVGGRGRLFQKNYLEK